MPRLYKKTVKKVTLGKNKTRFPKPPASSLKPTAKKSLGLAYDSAQFTDFGFKDLGSPPLIGKFDAK